MKKNIFLCAVIWIIVFVAVMVGFVITKSAYCLWAFCLPALITLEIV